MSTTEPQILNKLYKRAYAEAKKIIGDTEKSWEIAGDVIVKYLTYEEKHSKTSSQTVQQAVIDCLRKEYGSSQRGDLKKHTFLKEMKHETETFKIDNHVCVDGYDDDDLSELKDYNLGTLIRSVTFSHTKKTCYDLYMLGYNQPQISKIIGITQGATCQHLKAIKNCYKNAYLLCLLDEKKRDNNYFRIKIDWIKI